MNGDSLEAAKQAEQELLTSMQRLEARFDEFAIKINELKELIEESVVQHELEQIPLLNPNGKLYINGQEVKPVFKP